MVAANVAGQSVVRTFQDKEGAAYDIANIESIATNANLSSVKMDIDGQKVIVEITPTEAIHIIELLN